MLRFLLLISLICSFFFFSFTPREGGNEESYAIEQEALTMLESMPIDGATQTNHLLSNFPLVYIGIIFVLFGLFSMKGKRLFRLTKWANKQPKKAQLVITCLELMLISIAMYTGYNLDQLDIHISDFWLYAGIGISSWGFLSTPFFFKKKLIILPKQFYQQQLTFLAMITAAFINFSYLGNHLESRIPNSSLTKVVQQFDQSVFPSETASMELPIQPAKNKTKRSKKKNKKHQSSSQQKRPGVIFGLILLAIFMSLVLASLLCAGICMIVIGVSESIGLAIAGVIVTIAIIVVSVYFFRWLSWKIKLEKEIPSPN